MVPKMPINRQLKRNSFDSQNITNQAVKQNIIENIADPGDPIKRLFFFFHFNKDALKYSKAPFSLARGLN